jgi:hypoxanthine-guanine phosphoribosyltransferase
MYPPEYEEHLEGVIIPFKDIVDRILVLARAIGLEYKGKRPMIVCVLKGASVVSRWLFSVGNILHELILLNS